VHDSVSEFEERPSLVALWGLMHPVSAGMVFDRRIGIAKFKISGNTGKLPAPSSRQAFAWGDPCKVFRESNRKVAWPG